VKAVVIKGVLTGFVLLTTTWLGAGDKAKGDQEKIEPKVLDSGSFGIYANGKRIGTETFKIEVRLDYSVATAEVKVDDGTVKSVQTAEMLVTPKGELHSYIWRATLPVKEEATVEPNDQFLVEHLTPADGKKTDVPHLLPISTMILDDNFFSQRELLLWYYLRAGCAADKENRLMCGPTTFTILVPHQHLSATATLNIAGVEKINVKGVEKLLNKVILTTGDPKEFVMMNKQSEPEAGQWLLWVDDQYKIIRVAVTGANFEVVRD
jgi:hypothetical protein